MYVLFAATIGVLVLNLPFGFFGFLSVAAVLLVAILFVFFVLLFGRLVRLRRPSPDKGSVYECGERAIGQAWFNFGPRFYMDAPCCTSGNFCHHENR